MKIVDDPLIFLYIHMNAYDKVEMVHTLVPIIDSLTSPLILYSKFVWSTFGLVDQILKLARKCLMTGCHYHKPLLQNLNKMIYP